MSTYTPAHSFSKTVTYKSIYTDEVLLKALSGNPRRSTSWDQLVDVSDDNFFIELQKEIESGKDYTVVGRPIHENGITYLPLKHS